MIELLCTCDCYCGETVSVPDPGPLAELGVEVRFGDQLCRWCRAGDHVWSIGEKRAAPAPALVEPGTTEPTWRRLLRRIAGR